MTKQTTINPHTPTKYSGLFPQEYIDFCSQGGSTPEFCALKKISRQTFDNWCMNYPEMLEAKRVGKTMAEAWWLSQAKEHLVIVNESWKGGSLTTTFNTNLYRFIMAGRFRHTGERRVRVPKMIPGDYAHNLGVVQKMAHSGKYTVTELAAAAKMVADEMIVDQQVTMRKEIEDLKQIATNRQEIEGRVDEAEDGA